MLEKVHCRHIETFNTITHYIAAGSVSVEGLTGSMSVEGLTGSSSGSESLGIGEVLGITLGGIAAILAVAVGVTCTCICCRWLRRRKKLWKITQVKRSRQEGQRYCGFLYPHPLHLYRPHLLPSPPVCPFPAPTPSWVGTDRSVWGEGGGGGVKWG